MRGGPAGPSPPRMLEIEKHWRKLRFGAPLWAWRDSVRLREMEDFVNGRIFADTRQKDV